MEDFVKLIEREVVLKMDNRLELLNVEGGTLTVCSVKWARVNKTITDEANETYLITAVDYENNVLTLQSAFTGKEAFLYRPLFVHGTPRETNEEWTKNPVFELDKVPVMWLVEPIDEAPFGKESALERETDYRIIFFDSRDGTQWLTKQIHDNRTQSLLNMVDAFEKAIQKNRIFKKPEKGKIRNFNKLGTENLGSFEKNIINADLTAIDYRGTLANYRGYKCEC